MRVALFPPVRGPAPNPYLPLLERALRRAGVDVDETNPPCLSASWLWKQRRSVDVLHFHWLQYNYIDTSSMKLSLVGYLKFVGHLKLAKLLGYKLVWTAHNVLAHENVSPAADRILRKFMTRHCAAVFTHSHYAKNTLHARGKTAGTVQVVRHPSYIGVYPDTLDRHNARRLLDIDQHCTVFGCFGEIREYKGADRLVHAFAQHPDPNAALLLAGRPFSAAILADLRLLTGVDSRIRLDPRYIPDDEIQIYMNASDFIVFPFSSITVSGSMLLAMSFGKAVIFPDLGGLREYAGPDCGIVYDAANRDALTHALKTATATDPAPMGRCARRAVEAGTWQHLAQSTADVYNTLGPR